MLFRLGSIAIESHNACDLPSSESCRTMIGQSEIFALCGLMRTVER